MTPDRGGLWDGGGELEGARRWDEGDRDLLPSSALSMRQDN